MVSPQAEQAFNDGRLLESIKKRLPSNFNTFEQFKTELSKDYPFATQHLSDSKLQNLYYNPDIQKKRQKSEQFKQTQQQQIQQLAKTIQRRNPTTNKRKALQQATAKIQERLDVKQARRKIHGEKRYGQPVRQWQRNKAQEPSFRPEQYIRQRSRTGKIYNRIKPQKWTTKQTNFIQANKKLPYLQLAQKYNQTFPTKRPISSIHNKQKRLK